MIVGKNGEKVSAKVKVKILLQTYFSNFSLEKDCFCQEKLTEKEKNNIIDQFNKLKERIERQLLIK